MSTMRKGTGSPQSVAGKCHSFCVSKHPLTLHSTAKSKGATKTKEDLFMKLSGEIRNQIYELVVSAREGPFRGDEYTTWVRARHLSDNARKRSAGLFTKRPWREPALLQVSKQIRQEAMSYYYSERTFNLCLEDAIELPAARDFIFNKAYEARTVDPNDGEERREKTSVKYVLHIKGGHFKDLVLWFALPELLRYTSDAQAEAFKLNWHNRGTHVYQALANLIAIGDRARTEDLGFAELQRRFHNWAMAMVSRRSGERISKSVKQDVRLELKTFLESIRD